jgi:uncharacterized protein
MNRGCMLHIELNDLGLRGGDTYERTFPLELEPVVLGGETYRVLAPDGVAVAVDRIAGGFLVDVSVSARLYGACARCLQEGVVEVFAEQEEFVPTSKEGWDESELSPFVEGTLVDVGGLTREAVVLAIPEQILCSSECKGLCPVCGRNLNKEECGCPREAVDERWSTLRDIKFDK